jgi:hypothetical protein
MWLTYMKPPRSFEMASQYGAACGASFRLVQRRRIPEWDMMTCTSCYESNRDGIVPEVFPHVIPYLKSRGVEIKLNARGWINWPSRDAIALRKIKRGHARARSDGKIADYRGKGSEPSRRLSLVICFRATRRVGAKTHHLVGLALRCRTMVILALSLWGDRNCFMVGARVLHAKTPPPS